MLSLVSEEVTNILFVYTFAYKFVWKKLYAFYMPWQSYLIISLYGKILSYIVYINRSVFKKFWCVKKSNPFYVYFIGLGLGRFGSIEQ